MSYRARYSPHYFVVPKEWKIIITPTLEMVKGTELWLSVPKLALISSLIDNLLQYN
jgi:hypothetical protein